MQVEEVRGRWGYRALVGRRRGIDRRTGCCIPGGNGWNAVGHGFVCVRIRRIGDAGEVSECLMYSLEEVILKCCTLLKSIKRRSVLCYVRVLKLDEWNEFGERTAEV